MSEQLDNFLSKFKKLIDNTETPKPWEDIFREQLGDRAERAASVAYQDLFDAMKGASPLLIQYVNKTGRRLSLSLLKSRQGSLASFSATLTHQPASGDGRENQPMLSISGSKAVRHYQMFDIDKVLQMLHSQENITSESSVAWVETLKSFATDDKVIIPVYPASGEPILPSESDLNEHEPPSVLQTDLKELVLDVCEQYERNEAGQSLVGKPNAERMSLADDSISKALGPFLKIPMRLEENNAELLSKES